VTPIEFARGLCDSPAKRSNYSPVRLFFVGRAVRANITPSMANPPGPAFRGWSFNRFEITDLVEKASDLTLARHRRIKTGVADARSRRDFDSPHGLRPLRPSRCAVLLRSRTGQNISVLAFADVPLTHVAIGARVQPCRLQLLPWRPSLSNDRPSWCDSTERPGRVSSFVCSTQTRHNA
jgi:hypothetical protein